MENSLSLKRINSPKELELNRDYLLLKIKTEQFYSSEDMERYKRWWGPNAADRDILYDIQKEKKKSL